MNMNFDDNETTIWLHNPNGDPLRQIPIKIPRVFPNTKPEDALSLARRLHKLIAFT
jgi:hypothetical protein